MWEILQKILKDNITPNQLMLLYAFEKSIGIPHINPDLELKGLIKAEYITKIDNSYTITLAGKKIMVKYNNYFVKAKKKTSIQLMGKDYMTGVQQYRELFPKMKLPSGKPARVNEKTLVDIKTTQDSSFYSFKGSAYKYGYDRQSAFYGDGFKAERFIFIVIEKSAPYNIGIYECSAEFIEEGREKYKNL